jgi:ribonucleoside-diphosphate reductase alpha chain
MTRPEELKGETSFYQTKCGKLYITLNSNEEGKLQEIFLKLGRAGTCARAWNQTMGELLTDFLKTSKPERIVKHFKDVDCVNTGSIEGMSCQNAIACALQRWIDDNKKEEN